MEEYFLYFDESGNLGADKRYFVIACIVTQNPKELENVMKKTLGYIKRNFNDVVWNNEEIKASSCSCKIKEMILTKIATKNISIGYIVVDKYYVNEGLKKDKNCLYNYLLRILIDNYIHILKDNKINLILDNKSIKVKSQNSFKDYINIHLNYELMLNVDLSVEYRESQNKNAYNIQVADYIANSIYAYYEHGYNVYINYFKDKIVVDELFPRSKFGQEISSEVAITKKY